MRAALRHRVQAAVVERVAAQDAPDRHDGAADEAEGVDRFVGVVGAGRLEAAGGRRARRDASLVEANGGEGEPIIPRSDPISSNQLDDWTYNGLLAGAPNSREAPSGPRVYDAASGSLELRARAYLDVNCAHCHNPQGPAHTSGLDLRWSQHEPIAWGVGKRPVAAGRGSAGFEFAIDPGHPERSILLYRMRSTDPGVMMPETGRQLVDERGAALIEEWIAHMDAEGRVRE